MGSARPGNVVLGMRSEDRGEKVIQSGQDSYIRNMVQEMIPRPPLRPWSLEP